MAVINTRVDDLDNSVQGDEVEEVRFTFDGQSYKIDLGKREARATVKVAVSYEQIGSWAECLASSRSGRQLE